MKKAITIGLAIVCAAFLYTDATGAVSLSYAPEKASLTIGAGMEDKVPMTVTLNNVYSGTYYLWFSDAVAGNLPSEWIEASPSTAFLSRWWTTKSTTLTIRVPEDAAPGVYSGYLRSKAKSVHETAAPGNGMFIEVIVPSKCSAAPGIEITSFGPEYIWPPDNKMESVTVTGKVHLPDGCSLYEAGYSIDDEYGIYTSTGVLYINSSGEFTLSLPVEASRKGQDKDGRRYTISIYAEDEAGIGVGGALNAVVPHDQRNDSSE